MQTDNFEWESGCFSYGPYDAFACGLFAEDRAFEAWERMTYGGWVCFPLETHRSEWIVLFSDGLNQHTPLQEYFDAVSR